MLSCYSMEIIWRTKLANIKSAIKRNKQNEKKRLRNRVFRGSARTFIAKADKAIVDGTPESAEAVKKAISALDKAAEKGVIHKNNAARRKSRLMKRLNAAQNA
jgi:small subunit ribosomal protein S20